MYARRRRYIALMTICLTLFVSAWAVVRLISVPVAIAMCVVAAVIPPVAAIVANRPDPDEHAGDEQPDEQPEVQPEVQPDEQPEVQPDEQPDEQRAGPDDVELTELDMRLWEEELRNHRSDEDR
jgi:Protein of unknown function (DUF3099)